MHALHFRVLSSSACCLNIFACDRSVACRVLKQLGTGSVAGGVAAVARESSAQYSAASVLGVDKHLITEELSRLPKASKGGSDVDLAKLYSHLIGGKVASPAHAADSAHHRSIFEWCVLAAARGWLACASALQG
jgi:hypothetical protein